MRRITCRPDQGTPATHCRDVRKRMAANTTNHPQSGCNQAGAVRPNCKRSGRGFTLLELIISMALTATLMVLVWSLFSTYTKLDERSSRAAVELQLVRSISQQLRSDLEHFAVLPMPVDAAKPSGQNSAKTRREPSDKNAEGEESDDSRADSSEESGADGSNSERSSGGRSSDGGSSSSRSNGSGTSSSQNAERGPRDSRFGVSSSRNEGTSSNEFATGSVNAEPTIGSGVAVNTDFSRDDIYKNTFDASLPTMTYLRGNKTRLEFVTRLPYTVDVPTGTQMLGAETRYGTHQLVLYEFKGERTLETLLQEDPVLNPQRWQPPANVDPNAPKPMPNPLNPNDNVGLYREMKSWLHVTRDRQRHELTLAAQAAGLLVNGQLPSADPRFANRFQRQNSISQESLSQNGLGGRFGAGQGGAGQGSASAGGYGGDADSVYQWEPPPEYRHKRDHIPEVTKLQFRYRDKNSWLLDWNRENELPRAIEVAFDLDPAIPQQRAKEFEAAHAAMLGGQSLQQVLPPKDDLAEQDDMLEGLDSLMAQDLADPTAIVTEYRFVILLPDTAREDKKDEFGGRADGDEIDGLINPAQEGEEGFDASSSGRGTSGVEAVLEASR